MFCSKQKLCYLSLFIFTFIFCSFNLKTYAQTSDSKNKLFIISRPFNDSILLRWAPSDYKTWQATLKRGYRLERYTYKRDSILVIPAEKVVLSEKIMQFPLEKWTDLIEKDKYAAIAAQGVFGEDYKVDYGAGMTLTDAYNKKIEQEQRFSFTMFSADMSVNAAKALGLWYSDKSIKKNEIYVYRLMMASSDSLMDPIDTAYVMTGSASYMPLPQVKEITAEFFDKMVSLSWYSYLYKEDYVAYYVERSDDNGKTFKLLNQDPSLNLYGDTKTIGNVSIYNDSLPKNGVTYSYRIYGVNSFGEKGPYSVIVSGKGKQVIKATPFLSKYIAEKKSTTILWTFPKEVEPEIAGFKVIRSVDDNKGFQTIADKIKPNVRQFVDKAPLPSAYYKIVAYNSYNISVESHSLLVLQIDSIPPPVPTGFNGTADTLGHIFLSWKKSKESDTHGYRIWRSVSGNDEYTKISLHPVRDTFFVDSLSMINLNEKIYYKLMAVDIHDNESGFSPVLIVEKPDIKKPTAPVIKNVTSSMEGIKIIWIGSSSSDVVKHILSFKTEKDSVWKDIKEFAEKSETTNSFIDNNISDDILVIYRVRAVDDAGNFSDAFSRSISRVKKFVHNESMVVKTEINTEKGSVNLSWRKIQNVKSFDIYRKTDQNKYTLFASPEGTSESFSDFGLKIGIQYIYKIRAVYQDGTFSKFTDEIIIKL